MYNIYRGSVLLLAFVASYAATYGQEIRDGDRSVYFDDWYKSEKNIAEKDALGALGSQGAFDIEGNVFDRSRIKETLRVQNGGKWGTWGKPSFCPEGSFAAGYDMKIEPKQDKKDDTAMNGIKIICKDERGNIRGEAASNIGLWGKWVGDTFCDELSRGGPGYMTAFRLQVEPTPGGMNDATVANYVKFMCRGLDQSNSHDYVLVKPPGHGHWGTWGNWSSSCPTGSAICGIKTRVEKRRFFLDDTSLNDVEFYCC